MTCCRLCLQVKLLHALQHPNILTFHTWYETSKHVWLILEYCVGGDLGTLMGLDGRVGEPMVLQLAHDLASALQHVHASGHIHCDLRPANVLLDGEHAQTLPVAALKPPLDAAHVLCMLQSMAARASQALRTRSASQMPVHCRDPPVRLDAWPLRWQHKRPHFPPLQTCGRSAPCCMSVHWGRRLLQRGWEVPHAWQG